MSDTAQKRILIADDEPLYLRTTGELLRKAGYDCTCVPDAHAALEELASGDYDLVLSDLNMPGNLKLELLHEQRRTSPHIPLIVVTGVPSLPSAIESVRLGISDYLLKPVKYDDLLSSVQRLLASSASAPDRAADGSDLDETAEFPSIVGQCALLQELFGLLIRVAASDANVLITGETGTGKEVVARAIHDRSRRSGGEFQVVDCTAIPETLFESILFGHVKGSFTGATSDQVGLLKQADGGTVFFDEVGELPLPLQSKLLRVIQEQTFTPVGERSPVRIDTRFICATNRDLEMEVHAGRFRRDLFYRLAVIHLELPPLRARGDDTLLLAEHFLAQFDREGALSLADDARQALLRYAWPGNIRELRNAIERAVALCSGSEIRQSDLPAAMQAESLDRQTTGETTQGDGGGETYERALGDAERDYLLSLLKSHSGNVSEAARAAELSRQGLHKLLKKHGIAAADYRE